MGVGGERDYGGERGFAGEAVFFQIVLAFKGVACPGEGFETGRFDGFAGDFADAVGAAFEAAESGEDFEDKVLGGGGGDQREAAVGFFGGGIAHVVEFGEGDGRGGAIAGHQAVSFVAQVTMVKFPASGDFWTTV